MQKRTVGGKTNGYRRKPNGRRPRGGQMGGCIPGAIKNRRTNWLTSLLARGSVTGKCFYPCVPASKGKAPMAYIIWRVMCMNGFRIGMRPTTMRRHLLAILRVLRRDSSKFSEADPGPRSEE